MCFRLITILIKKKNRNFKPRKLFEDTQEKFLTFIFI